MQANWIFRSEATLKSSETPFRAQRDGACQRSSNNVGYTVVLPPQPSGQLPRWGAKNVLPLNLIALPCGAVYPPPSARPFFKGLLNCHVKAPLVKTTKRESPRIVISSGARNLPCTPVKQRAWDDDKRNTPGDASDNDTKKRSSHITSPPPRLEPLSSLC